MDDSPYRLDWSRPVAPQHPGERTYHATNDSHHILVVVSHQQLLAAEALARGMRDGDPDITVQSVLEDIIAHVVETRPMRGGELRLLDEDFNS